ncbi:hypothetical protein GCM10007301_40860 [Azorhizobium oxalatiphilum]|uniref:Uncharacterized protein n=1 Tax=Azorhizobium oxalatiphilum TaxID=980631 RepID=A0A917C7Z5_9HYPH|nr:hypothetical protein GCM10007301_40860 [Azorhizobium oxalatiphilum]
MAQQRGYEIENAAAIGLLDIAAGPEEGRDDGIDGTRHTIDVVQQFESGLQAGGWGHGQTINQAGNGAAP